MGGFLPKNGKRPRQNVPVGDVRLHKGHLLVAVQADIQAGLLTFRKCFRSLPGRFLFTDETVSEEPFQ